MTLNRRHQRTLDAICTVPVPAGVRWAAIEALFVALGANLREGSGSRVRVTLNDARATFHRPHPQPETKQYAVRNVRQFLKDTGVIP